MPPAGDDLSPPKKRFSVPSFSGDRKLSTGDTWEEAYADFMGRAWREFVPAEEIAAEARTSAIAVREFRAIEHARKDDWFLEYVVSAVRMV